MRAQFTEANYVMEAMANVERQPKIKKDEERQSR